MSFGGGWCEAHPMMESPPPPPSSDGSFEPQARARSNTWPLPRPDNYPDDGTTPPNVGGEDGLLLNADNSSPNTLINSTNPGSSPTQLLIGGGNSKCSGSGVPQPPPPPPPANSVAAAAAAAAAAAKKNSSRRNAWGNLSYADLITQAITSSPDKRLTLSQIYEWMVQNVTYFKDKGDSNSSAGWKNSIRHNLSLHNRFMRVQNEGTGKSSWWMINPDAKPGKSVRRRAASMETSKFEKRRGRAKKKVELMRNNGGVLVPDTTPSPSSSVSESLDLFPDSPIHSGSGAGGGGFQLSPDFRPRASSNTSSCGGRLSPIPAVLGVEPDWVYHNPDLGPNNVNNPTNPTTMSGAGTTTNTNSVSANSGRYSPDQLAGNLEQGMKLQSDAFLGYLNGQTPQQQQQQQPPPPPYTAPYEQFPGRRDISSLHAISPYGMNPCPIHRLQSCSCMQVQCKIERMSPTGMSPSYPHSEPSPDPAMGTSPFLLNHRNTTSSANTPNNTNSNSSNQQRPSSNSPPLTPQNPTGPPSTMMGQLMGALNNSTTVLDDLNINVESFQGGFDCNVEELIKHELIMEGSLDFNFQQHHQQNNNNLNNNHHHPHSIHHHPNHHPHQHPQQQQHQQTPSTHPDQQTMVHGSSGGGEMIVQSEPSSVQPTYSTAVTPPSWVH